MPALTTAFAQGLAASRPAAATSNAGFHYFATDTGILSQSTGSAWVQIAAGASIAGTVTSAGLSMPAEFSVASSPITSSGTIAVTKATQTANLLYSGPSSGSAAVPTFRAMVVADVVQPVAASALLHAAATCT
jgi:hypothetical protein